MSTIDKLAWIHIVDKKILCTRSKGKSVYYFPGGKREGNETDKEALIREVKEELGVNLLPQTIKFMGRFEAQAHGQPAGTIVKIICYSSDYNGKFRAAMEIEEFAWLRYEDKSKVTEASCIIFDWLRKKELID